jgi:hypothetical protein
MWVVALRWLLVRASEAPFLLQYVSRYYTTSMHVIHAITLYIKGGDFMPEENETEYIWIQDAQKEFGHSLVWFYRQIKNGVLTKYTRAGDLRIYLSRKELKDLFQFRPASKPKQGA